MKRWFVLAQTPSDLVELFHVMDNKVIHHGKMSAIELKRKVIDDPVTVLITSHHWSCVDVLLPQVKAALLYKTLPHLVEESVLSGTEQLHYALPEVYQTENKTADKTTVFVLARDIMKSWVAWAQLHTLNMQALVPAYTVLPLSADHLAIMHHEQQVWIRFTETKGYCIPVEQVKPLAEKWFSGLAVDVFGDVDPGLLSSCSLMHPQMMRLSDCLLHTQTFAVNFLQGDFKPRKKRRNFKGHSSKWALYLLTAAVICHMAYLGIAHMVLNARLSALKDQTLALYQKVYPDAKSVSNPRASIDRALKGGGNNAFADLLSGLSEGSSRYPITIEQLDYRENRLIVTGSMQDFSATEGLMQALKSAGLLVVQERAQQAGDRVELVLSIAKERV